MASKKKEDDQIDLNHYFFKEVEGEKEYFNYGNAVVNLFVSANNEVTVGELRAYLDGFITGNGYSKEDK